MATANEGSLNAFDPIETRIGQHRPTIDDLTIAAIFFAAIFSTSPLGSRCRFFGD
jgi:hypothetical protein